MKKILLAAATVTIGLMSAPPMVLAQSARSSDMTQRDTCASGQKSCAKPLIQGKDGKTPGARPEGRGPQPGQGPEQGDRQARNQNGSGPRMPPGQGQPGQHQFGQGGPGQGQPGQNQPGQHQPGQGGPGQMVPGQQQPGQKGHNQFAQNQHGQQQKGQKQAQSSTKKTVKAPKVGASGRDGKAFQRKSGSRFSAPPKGQEYRVVNDHLVLVNKDTLKIVTVLGLLSTLMD